MGKSILCADIDSSQASFYSKRRKHLEAIHRYCKEEVESYNQRSDEGADTDSQDSLDHGI